MHPPQCLTCGKTMWPRYYRSYCNALTAIERAFEEEKDPDKIPTQNAMLAVTEADGRPALTRLCCRRMVMSFRDIDAHQKYMRSEHDIAEQLELAETVLDPNFPQVAPRASNPKRRKRTNTTQPEVVTD